MMTTATVTPAATTTTTAMAKTFAVRKMASALASTTATAITKPLNLNVYKIQTTNSIDVTPTTTTPTLVSAAATTTAYYEKVSETFAAIAEEATTSMETATSIVRGNVQQQLTPLFYELLVNPVPAALTTTTIEATTTAKALVETAPTTITSYTQMSMMRSDDGAAFISSTNLTDFSLNSDSDSSANAFIDLSNIFSTSVSTILTATSHSPSPAPPSAFAAASLAASSSTASSSSSSAAVAAAASASFSILPAAAASATSIISTVTATAAATATATNTSIATATATTTTTTTAYTYLLGMAWPKAVIVAIFLLLILVTIVGNTLVILAVLTTRRLRTVTNCFVMNLAITDWLVGMCVMPPAVMLYIVGSWRFGWILCDIWISLDVLLCTGSILSLCAISLDRYLAVTQPLTYSKKRRSKRLALFMIFIVWVSALSITCPPYLGWYEPGRRQAGNVVCRYNQNKGYVVFSAMGSFFIPLAVMMYVYLKIGYVLTSRRQRIVRDANSERTADHEIDCDNFLSESEHFQCATPKFPSLKARWSISGSKKNSLKCDKCNTTHMEQVGLRHEASFYELVEISRLSSLIHCSAMSCKYGGPCIHTTPLGVAITGNGESNGGKHANTLPKLPSSLHYAESRASFSETCLTTTTTTSSSTTTTTTLQNVKFNDDHHQHQHHPNNHHHHHQHQQQHQSQQQKQHQHHHRIPMRISTTKRDTKTAKTLTIVMGGFVICWLPFFVYYLLIPFLPPAAVIEGLQTFLTWVGWVNCAINPFIYAFYNPDFRIAFWRLTCRRICKQKPPANHMAMFRG